MMMQVSSVQDGPPLRAAIAGASGYAGGELLRLLLGHPQLQITTVTAGSHAGDDVTAVHPHLPQLAGTAFRPTDAEALADADVVFLALPHGQSGALAGQLSDDTLVVDLGADHRLADADDWARFYPGPHAGTWTYGLPELPEKRKEIAESRRIAGPGCYATAIALAYAPILAAGLIEPDDLVAVAASGTTGAGRNADVPLLASEVMGSLRAYKAGGAHQHTPEVEQALTAAAREPVRLSFTPVLAPMPRGILATCTARLRPDVGVQELRAAITDAYGTEPFVRLLPDGSWPRTADTVGTNAAHLQVAADSHAGRAVVVLALDNLGKGAAGQAIQDANLALALPETTGLPIAGVAP